MAWTLVASDAVGYADGGTGHVYTLPSGAPTAGDLDILAVNSDTVVSTPSGFTLAVSAVNSQGAYLYYRYASGSEGSTVTITTSGSHPTVTGWQRWRGGLGFEIGVEAHVDTSSGSTTPAVSTGTLAGTGRLVVAHAALHALSPTAPNTPVWSGGYTDSGVTASNGIGSTAPALFIGYNSNAGTAAEAPSVSWAQATTDRYILVAVFTLGAGGTTVVTKTVATSWDTAAVVTKTVTSSWNTAAVVTKPVATTWDVAATATKTVATTWDVAGVVTKTVATSWDVAALGQVTKTVTTSWHVAAVVASPVTTTWNVAASTSKTITTSWDTAARVTTTVTTTWDVAGSPTAGIVVRPNTGTTVRPGTGTITRPYTGIVTRP
jgi:hypothetical protein